MALRIDEWVLPSHAQADRVAEGTLDIAITWVIAQQAERHGLRAHLLRAEPLHAVVAGLGSAEHVAAKQLRALVDADESTWSSWDRFAEEFAAHTGARIVKIDDGGITGDAFYVHVRRIGAAVLASPKASHRGNPTQFGPASRRGSDSAMDVVAGAPPRRRPRHRASCRGLAGGGGYRPTTRTEAGSVRTRTSNEKSGQAQVSNWSWTARRCRASVKAATS